VIPLLKRGNAWFAEEKNQGERTSKGFYSHKKRFGGDTDRISRSKRHVLTQEGSTLTLGEERKG